MKRHEWYGRVVEGMQLVGLAERSVKAYVREIRKLSEHHGGKDPRELSEEEVRAYVLHRRNVDKLAPASLRILHGGLRHLYQNILKRGWDLLELIRAKSERKPPVVLTVEEARRIIQAVRTAQNRAYLWTVYSCGLRLHEGLYLQVGDIDSQRMMLHVHRGKGARERYVHLPRRTLEILRMYWKTHRNKAWIFPALGRDGKQGTTATHPMHKSSVQGALRRALAELGIQKQVRVHTFRHSYATHLLEAGVHIRAVQAYLGHAQVDTTMVYLHLTSTSQQDSAQKIDQLMGGI